jgi:hypothetical protein
VLKEQAIGTGKLTVKKYLLTANVCANVCIKKMRKILEISEKIMLRVQIFN